MAPDQGALGKERLDLMRAEDQDNREETECGREVTAGRYRRMPFLAMRGIRAALLALLTLFVVIGTSAFGRALDPTWRG